MPRRRGGQTSCPRGAANTRGRGQTYWEVVVLIIANGSVGFFHNPALEALELRDIGARDLTPTLGSAITWADVDRMWAAEQERRDLLSAGYVEAACLACGSALYIPANERCG